jgi:peptide/nickel transport system substrate-binding protein
MSRGATALSLILVVAGIVLGWLIATGRAGASTSTKRTTLPRDQVLVTTGTAWGPESSFNPFAPTATGTVGLCYETLLRYDPLKDRYIPWLAESAGFTGKKTYTVVIRKRIRWSNGRRFTAQDVKLNFRLGRFKSAPWHGLFRSLKSIGVKGRTVTFRFKTKPCYIEWQQLIWNLPMVYSGQAASISGPDSLNAFGTDPNFDPIGTGPYSVNHDATAPDGSNIVWQRNERWWAAKQKLEPKPKPKYIADLQGNNNTDTSSGLLNGVVDLDEDFAPGIQDLIEHDLAQTYYPGKPYHLSANTVWLVPNTTHKPLDDPKFRRALAEAVSTGYIAGEGDYGGLVRSANATGLLPTWRRWVNRKQLKRLGFKHNSVVRAKKDLAAAGYMDIDGDGYVENKDGSRLELTIEVPYWGDWEAARDIIVDSERKAGIRLVVRTRWTPQVWTDRNQGDFDLEIDNSFTCGLAETPWACFESIFRLPIQSEQTEANFERYSNPRAWRLVKRLDRTPPSNEKKRRAIASRLERIFLTNLPVIPLYYEGVWAQWQTKHWTNWPSAKSKRRYLPRISNGYLQMTGIDMITHLKPVGS